MKKFIRAEEGKDNSVIYFDEEGNQLIRYWKAFPEQPLEEASTRSWRNNNPGNLVMGTFARQKGAIGEAGFVPNKKNKNLKFAVFPDFDTGREAQAARLKEGDMYIDLTLNEFLRKYTGVDKGEPDTEEVINYRKAIKFFTKFDMNRRIRSLDDEEYEKLLHAMMKQEGWREGKEEYKEIKKVVGVHMNEKHVISELLVLTSAGREWITKAAAIILAEGGLLDAIVVHAKKAIYLRPKFHHTFFRQMICK
jgi:hypothetical protein